MKVNSTYVLSGALVLAGVVALIVRGYLSSEPPAPPPVVVKAPEKVAVLVAAKDLYPGWSLDPDSLSWQETDEPVSRSVSFIRGKDGKSSLRDAALRKTVVKGEQIRRDDVVWKGEPGFIAAVLGKGMRAVSIQTSEIGSNAGLFATGDHADIILSLSRDEEPTPSPRSAIQPVVAPLLGAQTIVRNVRILAVDDQVRTVSYSRPEVIDEEQADLDPNAKSKVSASGTQARNTRYRTVTVEVTPKDAETLAVAKGVGALHLALRSVSQDDQEKVAQDELEHLTASGVGRDDEGGSATTLSNSTSIYDSLESGRRRIKLFRGDQKDVMTYSNK
ncbi:Flp pilus assembly protein CpaB [Pectobacterium sp. B1J-3]|uniref:Flp pilus assembly protein CpaB n=1 Tax=Pectobacterium sp. B1J-3 TaxID=3385371 RepID=UPI003906268B